MAVNNPIEYLGPRHWSIMALQQQEKKMQQFNNFFSLSGQHPVPLGQSKAAPYPRAVVY